MACVVDARRRVLLSIIRAPSLSPRSSSAVTQTQNRSLHSTTQRPNDGFSVSFGPKIDSLLDTRRSRTRGSKKTGTQQAAAGKTSKPRGNFGNAANYLHMTPVVSGDGDSVTNDARMEHGPSRATTNARNGSSSPDDQTTLELSGDAYDTISRPKAAHTKNVNASLGGAYAAVQGSNSGRGGWRSQSQEGAASTPTRRARAGMMLDHRQGQRPSTRPQSGHLEAHERLEKMSTQELTIKRESWRVQKDALQKKFGETGWNPRKKLSPDAIEGIRTLHEQDAERYSTDMLSQQFKVSPEAIRRILKSKWRPTADKMEDRRQRWARRHDRIWDQQAALGLRPERLRNRDAEGPEAFEEEVDARRMLGQL